MGARSQLRELESWLLKLQDFVPRLQAGDLGRQMVADRKLGSAKALRKAKELEHLCDVSCFWKEAVFAGESITPGELVGIALVSGGIISLAFRGRSLSVPSLPYALGTGGFIAAYSVVDGIGARLSGAPLAYTVWM